MRLELAAASGAATRGANTLCESIPVLLLEPCPPLTKATPVSVGFPLSQLTTTHLPDLGLPAIELQIPDSTPNRRIDTRWTSRRFPSRPSPTKSLARTSPLTPPPRRSTPVESCLSSCAKVNLGQRTGEMPQNTDTLHSPAPACARRSRFSSSHTTARPLSSASCCPSPRALKVRMSAGSAGHHRPWSCRARNSLPACHRCLPRHWRRWAVLEPRGCPADRQNWPGLWCQEAPDRPAWYPVDARRQPPHPQAKGHGRHSPDGQPQPRR